MADKAKKSKAKEETTTEKVTKTPAEKVTPIHEAQSAYIKEMYDVDVPAEHVFLVNSTRAKFRKTSELYATAKGSLAERKEAAEAAKAEAAEAKAKAREEAAAAKEAAKKEKAEAAAAAKKEKADAAKAEKAKAADSKKETPAKGEKSKGKGKGKKAPF